MSGRKKKYITVFPGKRDQYQIPIALLENGRLDLFITDLFNKGFIKIISSLLGKGNPFWKRYTSELEKASLQLKPFPILLSKFLVVFFQRSKVIVWEDLGYAKIATQLAEKRKTNLILYEFQAEYAFKQSFSFPITKILFQFHPHPVWEHAILLKDSESHPILRNEILKNTRLNLSAKFSLHTHGAWKNADHIIVASGITKTSLRIAGCSPEKISVVPYGFSQLDTQIPKEWVKKKPSKPYFLYVGSGSQRKGIHNLGLAWEDSKLCKSHELVVVARTLEPHIQDYLSFAGIIWIKGLPKPQLNWYFQNAVSFVLPSLSEGFGQVYLEALANGCPIIGSRHSMLPDINGGERHIEFVDPLDRKELIKALIMVAQKPNHDLFFEKSSIKSLVLPYTWENFRKSIQIVLDLLD